MVLVCGADDAYAMPLAVTLRSAIDHLDSNGSIRVFIIDGGLTAKSRNGLLETCDDARVCVEFLHVDMSVLQGLPVSQHISASSYLRLLIPELLPSDIQRVIYLDSDLVIRRDLQQLWSEPQSGYAVLAAQDYAAPYLDSSSAIDSYQRCKLHLGATHPIKNYSQLGMSPSAKYFNAGVLLVDVDHWRREEIAEKMLACLTENRDHVLWWDQYALNVVLYGDWGELDPRWNQGAHLYDYPNHRESPFDRQTFKRLKSDPWIVHFTSEVKPWNYFCPHPHADLFQSYLSRTAWADYEPEVPANYLHLLWKYHSKSVKTQIRRRRNAIRCFVNETLRAA